MIRSALSLTATTALALGVLAAPASAAPPADRGGDRAAQVHRVQLDALNDSGVSGTVTLVQRGDQLRVVVNAKGLTPGVEHPQHIHGLADDAAVCPSPEAADDLEGSPEYASEPDELISLAEGAPLYGGILVPFDPTLATASGVLSYTDTFALDSEDLLDLSDEVVVLHGAVVDGEYQATLPVACGDIR